MSVVGKLKARFAGFVRRRTALCVIALVAVAYIAGIGTALTFDERIAAFAEAAKWGLEGLKAYFEFLLELFQKAFLS